MKDKDRKHLRPINLLKDALVDDILNSSDEEVLDEFIADGGDPEANAENMRSLFQRSLLLENKKRMDEAKAGVIMDRQVSEIARSMPANNISNSRARLRTLLNRPGIPDNLTLAARNESELSEDDVNGMLQDLSELGINISEEDKGE